MKPELLSATFFFATVTPIVSQKKYLWLILCWKLILGRLKLNVLMEKHRESFYENGILVK